MQKRLTGYTLALLFSLFCTGLAAQDGGQDNARIVAVGDVHGDYDNFLQVLRQAGVVNRRGNWIAGDTQLVQLGDLPDRGPDTDRAIALLQKLERQAGRRGGQVHALIGNHEAMNILGDLRYVHPGEYQAFIDRDSERRRERYYQLVVESRSTADPQFEADQAFRDLFEEQVPLGYVEHRVAWSPEGEIGAWVLQHDSVVKIGRFLFLHGGISPQILSLSLEQINAGVREELREGESGQSGVARLATSEDGPLWYRGLASHDEVVELDHVNAILERYDVDHIVVGHTPGLGTIVPRFKGKVLVIDSGISAYYGGHLSSLTVVDGELYNTQQGERLPIPVGDTDPVPYFEAVLELEPNQEALQRHLQTLRRQP